MPAQYLLLTQRSGCPCEVIFYDSDKQTRTVMFSGRRWPARHYLKALRASVGWETVPAYCEKKPSRRGYPAAVVECTDRNL